MCRGAAVKCATYGSLFIGQSSGTQVETEGKHDGFEGFEPGTSNAREICFAVTRLPRALHLYSSTALYTLHPLHPPSAELEHCAAQLLVLEGGRAVA